MEETPMTKKPPAPAPESLALALPSPADNASIPALESVLKRANRDNPDAATMEELRRLFDQYPELWQSIVKDLQGVNRAIVKSMTSNGVSQEVFLRHVDAQRTEMGYADAPPLERPLIDHVVTCWLRLQKTELSYTGMNGQSITLTQADFWERKLTQAQARYLRAIETLARVRRLARPSAPLQVNIATQQVNHAHSAAAPAVPELPATDTPPPTGPDALDSRAVYP